MKAIRRIAIVAAASLIAMSGISTTAHARQRARTDEGSIAGTGIPLMTTTRTAVGLIRPVFVTYAPGDPTRLFVLEKRGVIRIIKIDVNPPNLLGAAFLNIDPLVTGGGSEFDEQGLLGIAFHPNYQQNGWFYVYYTTGIAPNYTDIIARYQVSANPDMANTAATIVYQFADNQANHNGGWIGFKPGDTLGYLYFANGDGGGSCDNGTQHAASGNGQSLTSLFGKILRIDIDGLDNIVGTPDDDGFIGDPNKNYSIPPTNPAIGGPNEIWDYGLRNPFRCSFDRGNGDLYIGDVGQFQREEVNYEPSNSPGGVNYGWRCMEGTQPSSISTCSVAGCPTTACGGVLVCPVAEYTHAVGCAITGGYVYRGSRMPQLQGTYFYADYAGSCGTPNHPAPIFSFKIVGGVATNQQTRTTELAPGGGLIISGITSFGEDYFGEIYICDQEGGEIFKIVPRPCLADIVPNGERDVLDLLAVINAWGPCPGPCPPCPADVATPTDCQVTVLDLLIVINNWGTCP